MRPRPEADQTAMPTSNTTIRRLDVPIRVLLGSRRMPVREVTSFVPGSLIELPKAADRELELLANNLPIATGTAVKIGENFGLKVAHVGDVRERMNALVQAPVDAGGDDGMSDEDLAEALLAGQL